MPLASRLPVYEEALDEGELGLLFEPRDIETLGAQLERLVADAGLRERLRAAAEPLRAELTWPRVADDLEDVYAGVVARRHAVTGNPKLAARLRSRPLHRRRPAHAHRPLARLRDAGRGAAGHRPRAGARARSR